MNCERLWQNCPSSSDGVSRPCGGGISIGWGKSFDGARALCLNPSRTCLHVPTHPHFGPWQSDLSGTCPVRCTPIHMGPNGSGKKHPGNKWCWQERGKTWSPTAGECPLLLTTRQRNLPPRPPRGNRAREGPLFLRHSPSNPGTFPWRRHAKSAQSGPLAMQTSAGHRGRGTEKQTGCESTCPRIG